MLSFKEALKGNQHKIDKNKNGKVDAHDFHLLRKSKGAMKEDITEATVTTKKYSWGTMKTVHHGKDFSIPLHPEHHQAIAKLKDEQEHKFKDETGRHWTARRKGEDVHFHSANDGPKTQVKHSTMSEEVIDEAKPGLYANIHAKRKRIEAGSGEKMRKAGSEGAPSAQDFKDAAKTAKEEYMYENGDESEEDDEEEKCEECGMPEAECECDHEDEDEDEDEKEVKEAKKKMTKMCEGKHVIGVTISNPNHPAVTQRNEKKFRKAKVSAPDKDTAINTALAYYKKRGYKVHDHNYQGLHNEEYMLELEENTVTHQDPLVTVHDQHGLHTHANLSTANRIFNTNVSHTDVHKKPVKTTSGREDKRPLTFAISQHHASEVGHRLKEESQTWHHAGVVKHNTAGTYHSKAMNAYGNVVVHKKAFKSSAEADDFGKAITKKRTSAVHDYNTSRSTFSKEEYEMNEMRINGREYASQGVMHPDHAKMDIHKVSGQHVDFYASKTGDKMQGKVVKNDGKNVHIQAHKELGDGKLHKFKVTPNLPKKVDEATTTMSRDKKGNITSWSYSGDWKKTDVKKNPEGKVHNLAGQALKKTKELAKEETDIDEQAPVAPTLDKKYIKGTPEHKAYKATKKPINGMPTGNMKEDLDEKMDMAKADMGDVIKDFKQSDAPQFAGKSAEKRREMAIAAKLQADKEQKEERQVKNFKQFREDIYKDLPITEEIEEIEEQVDQLDEIEFDKSGRYVHKGKYGTSYQGDDDEDDDNGKPKKPAPTGEKRGRGRPAGSTSGARQKGATAKKRSGVEYTGYPLHLPNSNK